MQQGSLWRAPALVALAESFFRCRRLATLPDPCKLIAEKCPAGAST